MKNWLCRIHAKLKNGKVVSSTERFNDKASLPKHLNALMDSGLYLSCGASIRWSAEPMPPIFPEQCRCDHKPCRCKRHPESGLIYVTLESNYRRIKAESKLHCPDIVRAAVIYDPCPTCDGTGGIRRLAGRSEEVDSPSVQQTQSVQHCGEHGACLRVPCCRSGAS